MKNLKSIRDAAEFSKENNKMFEHTPRRLFHELMSEDLTIKLLDYIQDLEKCVEVHKISLQEIAGDVTTWKPIPKLYCHEKNALESLTTVEGIMKKYE